MRVKTALCAWILLLVCLASQATAQTGAAGAIVSRSATADGISIHYLAAGGGSTVILLHGYTQTSRMLRPLIPKLAGSFTVIAPDLPGIGDSDIAKDGPDMKTVAIRIHDLAKSLGVTKASVLEPQMQLVGANVTIIVLKDTGYWVMEERPEETMAALVKFL